MSGHHEIHYSNFDEYTSISKNMLDRIHHIVDITKEMSENNLIDTHGRTMNFTFAIRNGKIVETAWCNYRRAVFTIPKIGYTYYNPLAHKESKYTPCLHSEIACLSKLKSKMDVDEDFSDFDIVNVRLNRTPKFNCVLSAPCINCQSTLSLLNVRKCYFYDGEEWKCVKCKIM